MASTQRQPVGSGGFAPLSRVLGQVERQLSRRIEAVLAAESLTVDQWRVLDLLADTHGHPMSEIAAQIVIPGPTLTKIVDRLVDAALAYRLVDDADRRRVLVFASGEGRARHADLAPRVGAVEAELLDPLQAEGPELLRLVTRLADQLGAPAGQALTPLT